MFSPLNHDLWCHYLQPLLYLAVIDLQKLLDFLLPAILDKINMLGMHIVGFIIGFARKLHGEAEIVCIFGTDLLEYLKLLNRWNRAEGSSSVLQETMLLLRAFLVFKRKITE